MSYDPNRTSVMPDRSSAYPITDELPAVRPGGSGPTDRLMLKILAVVLVATIAAIAAILVVDNQRSSDTVATTDPTPTGIDDRDAVDDADQDDAAGPTAVELDEADPGFFRIVGVAEGLNIRSGPGTNNPVVGAFGADARHVFATGERVSINGGEWTQITFGPNDAVGWVSARFLAPDVAPPDGAAEPTPAPVTGSSVVCFRGESSGELVASLRFVDGVTIDGRLRTIDGSDVSDQTLSGTLRSGQASVELVDEETGRRRTQTWTFSPATVDMGSGRSMRVVPCASVQADLG